jgi:hypothetical protein
MNARHHHHQRRGRREALTPSRTHRGHHVGTADIARAVAGAAAAVAASGCGGRGRRRLSGTDARSAADSRVRLKMSWRTRRSMATKLQARWRMSRARGQAGARLQAQVRVVELVTCTWLCVTILSPLVRVCQLPAARPREGLIGSAAACANREGQAEARQEGQASKRRHDF